MISTSPPSRFPLSSSFARVTPSIQADLEIMNSLCQYYRQLFDITNEEMEHEKKCVETLLSVRNNQCQPRKLSGTMVSVYFESRADELNGYAMNILEEETTADTVIDKLLNQINWLMAAFNHFLAFLPLVPLLLLKPAGTPMTRSISATSDN